MQQLPQAEMLSSSKHAANVRRQYSYTQKPSEHLNTGCRKAAAHWPQGHVRMCMRGTKSKPSDEQNTASRHCLRTSQSRKGRRLLFRHVSAFMCSGLCLVSGLPGFWFTPASIIYIIDTVPAADMKCISIPMFILSRSNLAIIRL